MFFLFCKDIITYFCLVYYAVDHVFNVDIKKNDAIFMSISYYYKYIILRNSKRFGTI